MNIKKIVFKKIVFAVASLLFSCVVAAGMSVRTEDRCLFIEDVSSGERLFNIPGAKLMIPDFAVNAELVKKTTADGRTVLEFAGGALASGKVEIAPKFRGFTVNAEFTPSVDVTMSRLNIFPAKTKTLCYKINNYRNLHATEAVWEDVVLGVKEFATDTYSKDWQFAPHPSAMLFTRNDAHLLVGTTCAPVGGYGLYIKGARRIISDFYLHYGDAEWGWKIKAGEKWKAPEFYFAFGKSQDIHDSWAAFATDLIKGGYIADPAKRKNVPWYREQYYCTWTDQAMLSGYIPDADLKKQSLANPSIRHKSWLVLTEKFVLEAAEKIRREKLPIRTILIDGGWMRNTLDFRADPVRFPDFRGMVDKLHAMGFKVMVWWTWSECRDEGCEKAIGRHNTMLNGKRNCHGRWMADFSKKSAQEEWLKPTMRRLFSSEEGCYDLDGVKTDYQADKIHFDLPAEDPEWRGEENYFRRLYELFTTEMRKWKPDAQHCGCAGNWFLAEYIDLNRTYDVATENPLEHVNRVKMLRATAPGVLPVFDMHHHGVATGFEKWFESAARLDVPVHLGSLFVTKDDVFSKTRPFTKKEIDMIRKGLSK